MSITVKEALELEILSEAKLIAGESGLDRLIEKVNVAECLMNWRRNRQGEFFLSALYANKENTKDQYETIKLLIDTGASGLCLIDRYFVDLDSSIKKLADENSFPIIIIPEYIYYSDIISSIMNAIIQKRNFFMMEMMIDNLISHSENPGEVKRIANQINRNFHNKIMAIYCKLGKADLTRKCELIGNSFLDKDNWSVIKFRLGTLILLSFSHQVTNIEYVVNDALNKIKFIASDCYIGISNVYNGIENFGTCIEESLLTVELSEKILKKQVAYHKDIGLYKIILPYKDEYAFKSFYKEIISPITEYDKLYKSQLLETAIEYINNEGDFSKTADNLYIHENTVRYRINKIKEILGMNTGFGNFYEQLSIAIKLHNLFE